MQARQAFTHGTPPLPTTMQPYHLQQMPPPPTGMGPAHHYNQHFGLMPPPPLPKSEGRKPPPNLSRDRRLDALVLHPDVRCSLTHEYAGPFTNSFDLLHLSNAGGHIQVQPTAVKIIKRDEKDPITGSMVYYDFTVTLAVGERLSIGVREWCVRRRNQPSRMEEFSKRSVSNDMSLYEFFSLDKRDLVDAKCDDQESYLLESFKGKTLSF